MQKGLRNRTRKPLSNSRVLLYGVIWGYLGLAYHLNGCGGRI
jgi:hypothetical protein